MKKIFALIVVFALPAVVSAQALAPITNVNNLSTRLLGIADIATYILVTAAVIFIVWNIFRYMIKPGGEERKGHLTNVIWGIVGLFIIVSIWGLVNLLLNTFSTTPARQPIPNFSNTTQGGGIPANQIPIVQ